MELSYTRLHDWHHDDYETVKEHIHKQIGDLSQIRLFGRQVLCALYIRPLRNPKTGLEYTDKQQSEDVAQGKTMLIVAVGPSAFRGDDEYLADVYGEGGPPKIGDWVFARANTGESVNMCLDGAQVVEYEDRRGEMHPAYSAFKNGWPCRVVMDDSLIGLAAKPHQVV